MKRRIVAEHFKDGFGCVLVAKTIGDGLSGSIYEFETYSKASPQGITIEYATAEKAFDALERWEKRHNIEVQS